MADLHSPMLRPKHERQLLKILSLNDITWGELSIGMLWHTPDLKGLSKNIKAILDTAQGESALEEFLKELQDQWEATKLELIEYKGGRIYLIKNWDALFGQLTDRLSDLAGMKQSPYFKPFEATAIRWESKLNVAQAIFDVFIDEHDTINTLTLSRHN